MVSPQGTSKILGTGDLPAGRSYVESMQAYRHGTPRTDLFGGLAGSWDLRLRRRFTRPSIRRRRACLLQVVVQRWMEPVVRPLPMGSHVPSDGRLSHSGIFRDRKLERNSHASMVHVRRELVEQQPHSRSSAWDVGPIRAYERHMLGVWQREGCNNDGTQHFTP